MKVIGKVRKPTKLVRHTLKHEIGTKMSFKKTFEKLSKIEQIKVERELSDFGLDWKQIISLKKYNGNVSVLELEIMKTAHLTITEVKAQLNALEKLNIISISRY